MGAITPGVGRPAWGAVFALLLALSFPFRVGELHFDVGILVGWLALAPLAIMLEGLSPRRAFLWTTGFATLGFAERYGRVRLHGEKAAEEFAAFGFDGEADKFRIYPRVRIDDILCAVLSGVRNPDRERPSRDRSAQM